MVLEYLPTFFSKNGPNGGKYSSTMVRIWDRNGMIMMIIFTVGFGMIILLGHPWEVNESHEFCVTVSCNKFHLFLVSTFISISEDLIKIDWLYIFMNQPTLSKRCPFFLPFKGGSSSPSQGRGRRSSPGLRVAGTRRGLCSGGRLGGLRSGCGQRRGEGAAVAELMTWDAHLVWDDERSEMCLRFLMM